MPRCFIDHLVVTAPSLAVGAAFVRDAIGVEMQRGGEHPRMGTHNLLLRLGDAVFLEVLAPNPDAPAPGRPRWFGLDHLMADFPPALRAWVARTTDIRATSAGASEPLGAIEPMTRGDLNWLITIPGDVVMPFDGVAPALIEWQAASHPAAGMRDCGLALLAVDLFHPQVDKVSALLRSLDLDGPLSVAAPAEGRGPMLVARIDTPAGVRVLPLAGP